MQAQPIPITAHELFFANANEARQPDPPYTVSEWADKNRYLSSVASAEPGLWRTKRTPYLREIMDCLSSYSPIEKVIVMKGAQIGMSEAGLNFVGYAIQHSPGPCLYVMPTVDMSKKISKSRLAPMIEASPTLSERIKPARSRDSGNTLLSKEFDGGVLLLTGANSAAGLASMPIRYLVLDEVDRYPLNVDEEGDPVSLAIKRTANFIRRKIFELSTPVNKDTSRIAGEFEQGDKRYYHVPCDDCGVLQPIIWKQIKWPKGKPEEAAFICAHCGHPHQEHRKADLMNEERGATWIATKQPARLNLRSYHISALYSPWYTWAECARDFLEAKQDPSKLQTFVNTDLGEPWEDKTGETVDPNSLFANREDYPILPPQTAILTAGIDVQPDRLELELVAWGRGEESWNIDYQIFPGDPSSDDVWTILDEYLAKRWPHPALEQGMRISATCIDTGGSNTQAVYRYVGPRSGRRIWGIKGYAGPRPVWPKRPSRNNKGKINLYLIGVDSAKEIITARFRHSGPNFHGPGTTHFHKNRDKEYFEQLTAERKVTRFHKGFKKTEWEKSEKTRNEALDCRVYAYAALQGLLSAGASLEREAQKLEANLQAEQQQPSPNTSQKVELPQMPNEAPALQSPMLYQSAVKSIGRPRQSRRKMIKSSYM